MATKITYLIVSGSDDISAVQDHPFVAESGLERQDTRESGPQQAAAVTFAVEQTLEEGDKLIEPARKMSTDFPEATVVLCEVEERFDQVERLQTIVFMDGKNAGDIEHGYIYNVGQEG